MCKKMNCIIISIVVLFSAVLGSLILMVPKAVDNDNAFSAVKAMQHIEVISRKPHSVFETESHEEVRQYIYNVIGNGVISARARL